MSQADIVAELAPAHRKALDPASPMPARMMAARGMAPLPPREMVMVLAGLSLDTDTALADAARASLVKLPDKIYDTALAAALPAAALAPIALALTGRDGPLEKLVLARTTPDPVVAQVAGLASEKLAEIIANDQERLLRSHDVVGALRTNTSLLRSSLDRVFDFLVRAGVIYDDFPEAAEALARLSSTDFEKAAAQIDLPPEVQALLEPEVAVAPPPAAEPPSAVEDIAEQREVAKAAEDVEDALEANIPQEEKEKRIPMLKLVGTLNIAQKVALAMRGNKEARTLLVRDSNRLVAVAAIRSPRMTEGEVKSVAASRTVHDDVIRIIVNSRELSRSYGVKLALASNPKTPLPMAMKLLPLLRENDIKLMAKSKNVSAAISTQAKRMMAQRQK